MKSILPVLAFALVAGLTAPVLAETTATGIGTGIANATAGAENNFGNTFGGASIGGAYCVDTVVIGPFGGSKTMRPCVAAQVAESAGKLGTMSAAEVRAIQLAVLKDVGYVLKPADKSTASTKDKAPAKTAVSTKAKAPEMRDTFWHDGKEYRLTTKSQIAAFNACQPVPVKQLGVHIKMKGC